MKYQLVALGPSRTAELPALKAALEKGFNGLGLDPAKFLDVLDSSRGADVDRKGQPVGVWFGGSNPASTADLQLLRELMRDDFPVLPLVESLQQFHSQVPTAELGRLNGRQWDDDRVPGDILRLFGLTRERRQAFISYRRADAQGVANQLFDYLSKHGFLPFLDIASVEGGEPVQEVLHHRLADMDLVLFLDSPSAAQSKWIIDELATAAHLGVGVLQLVWPSKGPHETSGLSRCRRLKPEDFVAGDQGAAGLLTDLVLEDVLKTAEEERIQSLGFRRRRVVSEFMDQARDVPDLEVILHPFGPMEVRSKSTANVVAWAMPFVGLPDGWSIHQTHAGVKDLWETFNYKLEDLLPVDAIDQTRLNFKLPIRIVYDALGIRPRWLDHLMWLSRFLPAKTLSIDRSLGDLGTPVSEWLREVQAGGGT